LRFIFVATTQFKSLFMWTTRILYLENIFFIGDNIEIHLVFTLHSNFRPLVLSSLTSCHVQGVSLVKNNVCKWFITSFQA
jgi:hypothetical protein